MPDYKLEVNDEEKTIEILSEERVTLPHKGIIHMIQTLVGFNSVLPLDSVIFEHTDDPEIYNFTINTKDNRTLEHQIRFGGPPLLSINTNDFWDFRNLKGHIPLVESVFSLKNSIGLYKLEVKWK